MNDTITNASVIRTIISNKTLLTSVGTLLEEALANFGTLGHDKKSFFFALTLKLNAARKAVPITVLPDLMSLLVGDRAIHFKQQNDTSQVLHSIMEAAPMLVGDAFNNSRAVIQPLLPASVTLKNHEQIRHHLWIAHMQGTMPKTINMIVQRTAQRMLTQRQRGFIGVPIGSLFSFEKQQGTIDFESRDSDGLDCIMSFQKSEVFNYIGTVIAALFAIEDLKNNIFRKNDRTLWSGNDRVVRLNLKSLIDEMSESSPTAGSILSDRDSPLNLAIEYGYLNFSETPAYTQFSVSPMYTQLIFDALLSFYTVITCAIDVTPEGTPLRRSEVDPSMFAFSDGMGGEYLAPFSDAIPKPAQKPVKSKAPVKPVLTKRDTLKNSKVGKQ